MALKYEDVRRKMPKFRSVDDYLQWMLKHEKTLTRWTSKQDLNRKQLLKAIIGSLMMFGYEKSQEFQAHIDMWEDWSLKQALDQVLKKVSEEEYSLRLFLKLQGPLNVLELFRPEDSKTELDSAETLLRLNKSLTKEDRHQLKTAMKPCFNKGDQVSPKKIMVWLYPVIERFFTLLDGKTVCNHTVHTVLSTTKEAAKVLLICIPKTPKKKQVKKMADDTNKAHLKREGSTSEGYVEQTSESEQNGESADTVQQREESEQGSNLAGIQSREHTPINTGDSPQDISSNNSIPCENLSRIGSPESHHSDPTVKVSGQGEMNGSAEDTLVNGSNIAETDDAIVNESDINQFENDDACRDNRSKDIGLKNESTLNMSGINGFTTDSKLTGSSINGTTEDVNGSKSPYETDDGIDNDEVLDTYSNYDLDDNLSGFRVTVDGIVYKDHPNEDVYSISPMSWLFNPKEEQDESHDAHKELTEQDSDPPKSQEDTNQNKKVHFSDTVEQENSKENIKKIPKKSSRRQASNSLRILINIELATHLSTLPPRFQLHHPLPMMAPYAKYGQKLLQDVTEAMDDHSLHFVVYTAIGKVSSPNTSPDEEKVQPKSFRERRQAKPPYIRTWKTDLSNIENYMVQQCLSYDEKLSKYCRAAMKLYSVISNKGKKVLPQLDEEIRNTLLLHLIKKKAGSSGSEKEWFTALVDQLLKVMRGGFCPSFSQPNVNIWPQGKVSGMRLARVEAFRENLLDKDGVQMLKYAVGIYGLKQSQIITTTVDI